MDDELLIDLVRSHRAFYDMSDPGYNDNSYKYRIWMHISSEMNVDISSCKARWNNLRDNYRKSLKKMTGRSSRSKRTKMYKYADQLSFLDEFFEDRRVRGLVVRPREEEYTDDVIEEIEEEEEEMMDNQEYAESNQSSQSQLLSAVAPEERAGKRKLPRIVSYSKVPSSESPVEYRIEEQDPQPLHPVDAFLAGIAPTLKSFSPYYLNLAKSEIFASVQKYEMRMLEPQLTYGKPSSTFIRDISIIAPSTSRSDSTSSPKEDSEG